MIDFEKKFNSFEAPGAFNLFDPSHPIEFYIGLDDKGRKSLIVRSKEKPEIIKGTNAIDVSIGQVKNNVWSLNFHLVFNTMSGLFYRFCDDLIETSRNLPSSVSGISFVVRRYNAWKKMFYNLKKDILPENEIMGLLGELAYLNKVMIPKYGEEVAISSWSGCDKAHKDFSVDNDWIEIKSTRSSSLTVKINSLEQLDSETDGKLVVYELEKMSETFDGYTLNNVVSDFLNKISVDSANDVLEKLKSLGYEYNDGYDKYVYRIVTCNEYKVSKDFPRITKQMVPSSIAKIEYEILKKDLEVYKL